MDFSKPNHQWVAQPYFRTERRHILNAVKPSYVTACVSQRKYYDYDTGRYLLDKMPSIVPWSWDDLIETDGSYHNYFNHSEYNRNLKPKPKDDNNNKWFTPKDDDFEEECRRDEERKRKLEEEACRRASELEKKAEHIRKEQAYQERVREREYQLIKERQQQTRDNLGYAYTLKNTWIIK